MDLISIIGGGGVRRGPAEVKTFADRAGGAISRFPLYFSILRQVCFLAFFYLRTPSFANFPDCVYIADFMVKLGKIYWVAKKIY